MNAKTCLMSLWLAALTAPPLEAAPLHFRSGPQQAQLLELFTSEGCSSCPPADKWISRLKDDSRLWSQVVPVVFHVDYWDRLDWPDRFASPSFSQRQRDHARAWGSERVYTPGFALNGKEWRGFFGRRKIPAPPTHQPGVMTATRGSNGSWRIVYKPATSPQAHSGWTIHSALLGSGLRTEVRSGENRGRKLHHDFTVLRFKQTALKNENNYWVATLPPLRRRAAESLPAGRCVLDNAPRQPGSRTGCRRLDRQRQADSSGTGIKPSAKPLIDVDNQEFEQLVERFYEPLYRFALSLAKREHEACDLTQHAFYMWATKGHQLRDRSKAKTWLFTTLHRAFLGSRRRETRFPHQEFDAVSHEMPSQPPTVINDLDGGIVVESIMAVDELYRAPLTLFYLEEHSYKEIAELLDLPIGTVMSRLSRGKQQLRDLLQVRVSKRQNDKIVPLNPPTLPSSKHG